MLFNRRKVVLVGTGMVGMSFAYSALNQAVCDELVLVDIDRKRAEGEAMDLNHGVAFASSSMKIYAGDYSDCADADMVVLCAGVSQKPGESRLDLLKRNAAVFRSIISPITRSGFGGIFLVATNPVDIMTRITYELSGFNSNRVFGSGTTLDTARSLSSRRVFLRRPQKCSRICNRRARRQRVRPVESGNACNKVGKRYMPTVGRQIQP